MEQVSTVAEVRHWREALGAGFLVGFVPTMGALHAGHRTLIERARAECQAVAVSIFVNPTQFNDADDCARYPQPLAEDLRMCDELGVDLVYLPDRAELYRDDYRFRLAEKDFSRELEGAFRPGHFDGVLTVVLKLLQIVQSTHAYFGEKDWQQLQLVKGMVNAFFLPTEVLSCPTVREPDGLAMSSRNVRLSAEARLTAAHFPRLLRESATAEAARVGLAEAGFSVDYIEDREGRRLGAVVLDGVRLIDNFPLAETASAAQSGGSAPA